MADKNETVWVVTGANRGIGLEFIVQILAMPDTLVVAGVRTPEKATDLQKLVDKHGDRLHIVKLDLANTETITVSGVLPHWVVANNFDNTCMWPSRDVQRSNWYQAKSAKQAAVEVIEKFRKNGVDFLVNNAGVLGSFSHIKDQEIDDMKAVLLTNVVGTFAVTKAFLPLLKQGRMKTILNISSDAGCLTQNASFIHDDSPSDAAMALSYRTSKVAVNMETTVFANDLKNDGFKVVSIHPGFVITDMGSDASQRMSKTRPGYGPTLTTTESVKAMLKLSSELTTKHTGKYLKHDGSEMPW